MQKENPAGREEQRSFELYDWVNSMISAALLVTLLFTFCVRLMGVDGASMVPTLYNKDRLVVVDSCWCRYRQGDIVIARKNSFSDEPIVKRVIAVGGQTVDIDFAAGIVYVDGEPLEEDYVNDLTYLAEGTQLPLTLGEDEYFLMGDNRNHSSDSRLPQIGPVDRQYLIGKAVFLLFPGKTEGTQQRDFSRIGSLHR